MKQQTDLFAKQIHNTNTTELSFHIDTDFLFTSAIGTFFGEGKGAGSPTHPTITMTTFAQEAERYLGHLIGAGAELFDEPVRLSSTYVW